MIRAFLYLWSSSALLGLVACSSGPEDPELSAGSGGALTSGGSGGSASGGQPLGTGGVLLGTGGDGAGGASGGAGGSTPGNGGTATGGSSVGGSAAGGSGAGGADPGGTGGAVSGGSPTAAEVALAMGRGVNLGQMFESTQHSPTLQVATPKIDAYYARGYRNLRIPITWTEPVGGTTLVTDPLVGTVDRTHPRLQALQQVVDYALSKPDLYVVINAHHEVALKTESRSAVLEQLWKDIADLFRDKPHRLLFEILNEPHRADDSAMPAADLRNMVGLAYSRIREVDPERIVIFGGNQWFGAHEVPAVWTSLEAVGGGDDPYVMTTFHHYDPWTFCGNDQGAYDDPWTEENQSGPMGQMAEWANTVGKGMPVYIGEWGVGWGSRYTTLTCNNIRQWYTSFDSVHAKGYGQPTAVWDDGGWFMIFNHASNDYNNNLIDCIEGTCTWDGTERFNEGCD